MTDATPFFDAIEDTLGTNWQTQSLSWTTDSGDAGFFLNILILGIHHLTSHGFPIQTACTTTSGQIHKKHVPERGAQNVITTDTSLELLGIYNNSSCTNWYRVFCKCHIVYRPLWQAYTMPFEGSKQQWWNELCSSIQLDFWIPTAPPPDLDGTSHLHSKMPLNTYCLNSIIHCLYTILVQIHQQIFTASSTPLFYILHRIPVSLSSDWACLFQLFLCCSSACAGLLVWTKICILVVDLLLWIKSTPRGTVYETSTHQWNNTAWEQHNSYCSEQIHARC